MTPTPSLSELAAAPIDDHDTHVLADLAALYTRADPVPRGLVERLQFAITLDALEAEVAELQRAPALTGVRGDEVTEAQTVTFTSSSVTTMVTITPTSADRARIDGWSAPGGGYAISLRTEFGTSETVADEDGRFVFADVARGLAQFVLRPPTGSSQPAVVTPSLQL